MKQMVHKIPKNYSIFIRFSTTGQFVITWASSGYCVFVSVVGVFLVIACCIQIHRLGKFLLKGQDRYITCFVGHTSGH